MTEKAGECLIRLNIDRDRAKRCFVPVFVVEVGKSSGLCYT